MVLCCMNKLNEFYQLSESNTLLYKVSVHVVYVYVSWMSLFEILTSGGVYPSVSNLKNTIIIFVDNLDDEGGPSFFLVSKFLSFYLIPI